GQCVGHGLRPARPTAGAALADAAAPGPRQLWRGERFGRRLGGGARGRVGRGGGRERGRAAGQRRRGGTAGPGGGDYLVPTVRRRPAVPRRLLLRVVPGMAGADPAGGVP